MNHIHNQDVMLMIWETNPELRKKNKFPVNLNIIKDRELNIGDRILIQTPKGDVTSIYTIEEVKNIRPSTLSKYNYAETICSWTSGIC